MLYGSPLHTRADFRDPWRLAAPVLFDAAGP